MPLIVDNGERICFQLPMPDQLEYRAALMGQLNLLGNWFTWDHIQSDYIDIPEKNEAVAQLWRDTVFEASFEVCMTFCEQLIACLNTDEDVQAALQAIINTQISESVPVPATYPPGQPNPQPNVNLAAGTNPTCDLDILWAQCLAIATQTNAAIIDVLEKIEVSSNAVELLDATTEVPIVGWVKEAVGGQAALDLVNYYQEAVNEEYNAQYTTTPGGVQDQIACALFCACKADCDVTIDRVYGVMKERLEQYISVPSLDDLVNLIEFVAGVSQDNTMVVDLAFFFAWGSIKLGSFFFGRTFDITLTMLLQLSVNDANNDWELLCTDCPEPIPGCETGESINFRLINAMFTPYAGRASWVSGQGWTKAPLPATPTRIAIYRVVLPKPVRMKLNLSAAVGEIRIYRSVGGSITTLLASQTVSVLQPDGSRTYTMPTITTPAGDEIMIDCGTSGDLAGIYLRSICWNYDV